MSPTPALILRQALSLSPAERAQVASSLLASLDDHPGDEREVERRWSEETERRMALLEAGDEQTLTRAEVRAAIAARDAERSA